MTGDAIPVSTVRHHASQTFMDVPGARDRIKAQIETQLRTEMTYVYGPERAQYFIERLVWESYPPPFPGTYAGLAASVTVSRRVDVVDPLMPARDFHDRPALGAEAA